jgi:hypothetical protein
VDYYNEPKKEPFIEFVVVTKVVVPPPNKVTYQVFKFCCIMCN